MQPRITVAIPVYNMEETVEKAVRSVMEQTYRDFELVVVDDGSTDSTPAILDSLAAEDGRVRVIHQKNQGRAGARSTGVKNARGEYLAWLDADDWMEKEALEKLIGAIDATGAEVALCNYANVELSGKAHAPLCGNGKYCNYRSRSAHECFEPQIYAVALL